MKLINSKVEILPQEKGILGICKQIEIAGRTCYKSEDKITENSAEEFVRKMINNKHTAMLEHGTVYLTIPVEDWQEDEHEFDFMFPEGCSWVNVDCDGENMYITTNLRHILEGDIGIATVKKYLTEPSVHHLPRVTVRFTCDRGVSHELVRHRVFSFAQESTRYCNYSKDKFGNELTFIIPSWLDLNEGSYSREVTTDDVEIVGDGFVESVTSNLSDAGTFLYHLLGCEYTYFSLLNSGWKPQQARQVLPNALKTEIVMTGFVTDWAHFFDLRTASNAHPDMQKVASELFREFVNNKYI